MIARGAVGRGGQEIIGPKIAEISHVSQIHIECNVCYIVSKRTYTGTEAKILSLDEIKGVFACFASKRKQQEKKS
jgi:hypothetical protein